MNSEVRATCLEALREYIDMREIHFDGLPEALAEARVARRAIAELEHETVDAAQGVPVSDIGDLLLLVKDAKFNGYLPNSNWSIIARVEAWLSAQRPAQGKEE